MRLVVLLALFVVGCTDRGPVEAPAPEQWTAQLAEVARGERTAVQIEAETLHPSDLRRLANDCESLERLTIVNVAADADRSGFDAAWRAVLPALPNLRRVTFDGPVDASIFGEEGVAAITHLNLPAAEANSSDFADLLAGQRSLVLLRLHAPGLQDRDLEALDELPDLRFLHLIDAPLTDAAVPHLAACETLESVYLDRARLTDEGWQELHRLRPDLHLHADLTHPVGGH